MLTRLGNRLAPLVSAVPWTVSYGLARSVLALGTLLTLAFSSSGTLFRPALGVPDAPYCDGVGAIGLWCVLPRDRLDAGRLVGIVVLAVVASGWRPRWTALPHWWVAFSVQSSITIPDGGDQVAAVLRLLLLPIALTDRRRWHWSPLPPGSSATRAEAAVLLAVATAFVLRLQVSGIYVQASVAKLGVAEWRDGTALYYWLDDPAFGPASWLRRLTYPLILNPLVVAAITWGTLALEFSLGIALFLGPRARRCLLVLGLTFHVGIGVCMGLWSFALSMTAALLLDLASPTDERWVLAAWRAGWQAVRGQRGSRAPVTASHAGTRA